MIRLIAAVWLALFTLPAAAQTFPERGRSPVVDQAGLLRPEQVLDLTSKSEALYAQTGRQFVVATIKSLEGRPIEDYGYRLLRHWELGDKERDDGVILIVAPAEHKVRIETGYGARVFLTDAVSSVIIREAIVPRFKAGDMGGGVVAGADAIISTMQLPVAEAAKRAKEVGAKESRRGSARGAGIVPVIFIVIIFFMIVGGMASRGGGRRYRSRRGGGIDPLVVLWGLEALSRGSRGGWGGGGSWGGGGGFGGGGGGFGGFSGGGGSGGGGGASGSW